MLDARPRGSRCCREALAPGRPGASRSCVAELGADAGLIGAGLRRVRGARLVPLAVCATPIGNLDDVTLRVLAELRAADVVLARGHAAHARPARAARDRARLLSYHEHNEAARVAELLPRLEAGERIALVTDAGMPVRLRSGRAARAGRARRRRRGDGAARSVGRRDGARRERARRRPLRVRRLPAAARRASSTALWRELGVVGAARSSRSSRRSGCRRRCARSRRSTRRGRSPSAVS